MGVDAGVGEAFALAKERKQSYNQRFKKMRHVSLFWDGMPKVESGDQRLLGIAMGSGWRILQS